MTSSSFRRLLAAVVLGCAHPIWLAAQGPPPDTGRKSELIEKYDADGDGQVSQHEMEAALPANEQPATKPPSKTKPRGREPATELHNDRELQALQDRFDENGDGKLDHDELQALRNDLRSADD